ncbi:uncharacterized protein SPAPADRAFT_63383 [Spathaspora passalidarum NRRL Y-27907]|uniref:DNA/RNA-binding protein Alba-like domain-containing protein n=1 Tax=Spathaspora passalidarum (strain NRRL Y-27907 / 11-Y1) TaxID=619300 RepID=G3AUI5_SPAPN|nr:uncharacterized protein SPAPADRAFT_63383 [Spathaspora passalidarum NRRL Y-27907]EGW30541.1 hypothetical protein SPAPADRAFT_63383 [Spathaspora passalidarum NRRL Y-27907]
MEALQEQFTKLVNETTHSISRSLRGTSPSIIKITKNDSIKQKVTSITAQLKENKIVLIASLSNSIPKAISVIEIAKSALKEENKSVKQFNKLAHLDSTHNPNYKPNQENLEGSKHANDDEDEHKQVIERDILESINGPKVYQLPIMYVILSLDNMISLTDWTSQ